MNFQRYAEEAAFAANILPQAADVCMRLQQAHPGESQSKADRSPVTVADLAAQAVICRGLLDGFPDDPIVAEEDSGSLEGEAAFAQPVVEAVTSVYADADLAAVRRWIDRGRGEASGRFWTLDPIDGTAGFVRGDQWVVALALIEGGEVRLGALAAPRLSPTLSTEASAEGSLLLAAAGEGAWIRTLTGGAWRRLQVSDRAHASRARLLGSVEASHTNPKRMERLRQAIGTEQPLIRIDSQAKFALVAGGAAELLVRMLSSARPDYREKIWDQAAGSLIVSEAGGKVTDLSGSPLDFSRGERLLANSGVLVSNGKLHTQALAALAEIEAE